MLEAFTPSFLCVWNKIHGRNLQTRVATRYFALTPSMIRRIVIIWEVVNRFFPKPFWFYHWIFFNSRSDATAEQSIINISSYSNKNYASIVLKDSEVTFHREGEDAAFQHNKRSILSNFHLYSVLQGLFHWDL